MAESDIQDSWVLRVLGVQVPSAAPFKLSVVKLAKSRLAWKGQRVLAVAELGRLQGVIAARFGASGDQAKAVEGARKRLDSLMADLGPELDDALDALLNADGPEQVQKQATEARKMLQRFQDLIDGDDILAEIDGNEVLPEMKLVAPLKQKLADIAVALQ